MKLLAVTILPFRFSFPFFALSAAISLEQLLSGMGEEFASPMKTSSHGDKDDPLAPPGHTRIEKQGLRDMQIKTTSHPRMSQRD